MKPLVFDLGAIRDLKEAASYYETQATGAGEWFETDVNRAFEKLRANPQHYPQAGRTTYRKYLTRRFKLHHLLPRTIRLHLGRRRCSRQPSP